jgi:hypothetical protein
LPYDLIGTCEALVDISRHLLASSAHVSKLPFAILLVYVEKWALFILNLKTSYYDIRSEERNVRDHPRAGCWHKELSET